MLTNIFTLGLNMCCEHPLQKEHGGGGRGVSLMTPTNMWYVKTLSLSNVLLIHPGRSHYFFNSLF